MEISMIHCKGLSMKKWAKSIHIIVDIKNQSPTSTLDGMTPYEAWYGTYPLVNNIWFVGSTLFSLFIKKKGIS